MPLTGAERARQCRQRKKENAEEYETYLRKERARYHKRKEKGEIKMVSDMTEREKRHKRKFWRQHKQKERNQKKNRHLDTPPPTPPTGPFPVRLQTSSSRQRMRRDRAKAYREIDRLKQQVIQQKKMIERYKKRLYRKSQKLKDANSPKTKTKQLLKGQKVNEHVRKTLLFHNVFLQGIKEKYQNAECEKAKQLLSKAFSSKLLRKYRMQKLAKNHLKLTQRRINHLNSKTLSYSRKSRGKGLIQNMKEEVESFLCREDNSRVKAGKKSTKTKAKVKRQIYLLNDTLKNLHLKYLSENPTRKMSYSLFCRLKPFFIRHPKQSDRETCLCKRHENLQFKANKLKQMKLIPSADLDDLSANITCNTDDIKCMYRTCEVCTEKRVQIGEFEPGQMVEWFEWKTVKQEKQKNCTQDNSPEMNVVIITVKEREKGPIQQLTDKFHEELSKCCKHFYNIKHQYKAIRQLKENLTEKDALIHIDFSENLSCKYFSEIQSMHFGASQRQISLHTGVLYTCEKSMSFCSISDHLKHGPSAIWGHLEPVLKIVKEEHPTVDHLYFLSDGPTTQYRCRDNFYLLSRIPIEMGFKSVNWNFLEASHGKGAPDGVGAVVKREADRSVSHGKDITKAENLIETLNSINLAVKLFLVTDEQISKVDMILKDSTMKTVAGTMKIHQVTQITIKAYTSTSPIQFE